MTHRRPASLLLAMALAGCTSAGGPTSVPGPSAGPTTLSETAPATATPRPIPTLRPGIAQAIDFEEDVWGIVASGDAVWVEGLKLYQLDGTTGEALRTVDGWWPRVSDGSLWYLREGALVRADPDTGGERRSWSLPENLLGTTVHDGLMWTSVEGSGMVTAFDLAEDKVRYEIPRPPGEVKWIEAWEGLIWAVVDGTGGHIVRIDPDTGDVVDEIETGGRPHSVVTAFGSLWITDHGTANVLRFAPDGTLQATVPGPGINVGIAATDDAVWAAGPDGIYRIDPATDLATRHVELGAGDWYGLAAAAGNLWLTTAQGKKVLQIPL
jgi:hypothetical protein